MQIGGCAPTKDRMAWGTLHTPSPAISQGQSAHAVASIGFRGLNMRVYAAQYHGNGTWDCYSHLLECICGWYLR